MDLIAALFSCFLFFLGSYYDILVLGFPFFSPLFNNAVSCMKQIHCPKENLRSMKILPLTNNGNILPSIIYLHYQKIYKYKWKYVPRKYFCRYISDGFYRRKYSFSIYWENYSGKKNLKQSKKKWWRVIFTYEIYSVGKSISKLWTLFIMSITKGIIDVIFQRALELFTFQLHC